MIADIGTNLEYETEVTIDASGLIAAPGLVDMHVHLRDPGQTEKEEMCIRDSEYTMTCICTLVYLPVEARI